MPAATHSSPFDAGKSRFGNLRMRSHSGACPHEWPFDQVERGCSHRKSQRPADEKNHSVAVLTRPSYYPGKNWKMPDVEAIADPANEHRDGVLLDFVHQVAVWVQRAYDGDHCRERAEERRY